MQIILTPEESEKHFHTALCDGLATLGMSDIQVDATQADYAMAKRSLKQKNTEAGSPDLIICLEDVYLEILRMGKKLQVIDHGGGGEDCEIGIEEVHERVQKTQTNHLMAIINEEYDGINADAVLQTVFFKDIVFG